MMVSFVPKEQAEIPNSARLAQRSNESADAGDRLAYDEVLHLVGALVGIERLDVAEEAGDVVVGDDTIAAQKLASPRDRLTRLGRAKCLRKRGVMVAKLAFIIELRQPKHQALARRQIAKHFCKEVL